MFKDCFPRWLDCIVVKNGAGCRISIPRAWIIGWIAVLSVSAYATDVFGGAQTDGTLGGPVVSFGLDHGDANFTVDASVGHRAGGNLYHSFDHFSITSHESATFTGPASVEHVINRVTGRFSGPQPSTIDGRLTSEIPNADFWLINPAGVVFGSHAEIDVPGAFHASTASEVRFRDGGTFSAVKPGGPETLSVAPPEAFGFMDRNPAGIRLDGTTMGCARDESCTRPREVSIVGGEIEMTDAQILTDERGVVRIVSVAGAGKVAITPEGVDVQDIDAFNDIRMVSSSPENDVMKVTAEGPGAGRVVIRGKGLSLRDAYISTTNTGVVDADDKGVDIALTGPLKIERGHISSTTVNRGNAGSISIQSAGIELLCCDVTTDSYVPDDALAAVSRLGNAGDILLDGGDQPVIIRDVSPEHQSYITADAHQTVTGFAANAGKITIRAGDFRLIQGGEIATTNWSQLEGDSESGAGDITIEANNIVLDGDRDRVERIYGEPNVTGIFANVDNPNTNARGGSVRLIAKEAIRVTDGAQIQVAVAGSGDPGSIRLEAGELIRLDDKAALTSGEVGKTRGGDVNIVGAKAIILDDVSIDAVVNDGRERGGHVTVSADQDLIITGASRVETTTNSSGPAGNVALRAGRLVRIEEGSEINSRGENGASGRITVSSDQDVVISGAALSGATSGGGGGKLLRIKAGNDLRLEPGSVLTTKSEGGRGDAGAIDLAGRAIMIGGGTVTTETESSGKAGDITLGAAEEIRLVGSEVTTKSDEAATGDAGNVKLTAGRLIEIVDSSLVQTESRNSTGGNIDLAANLVHLFRSHITSSVFGPVGTRGGDISISGRFLALNHSEVLARAFKGRGGDIQVGSDYIVRSPDSNINASSQLGIDGTVLVVSAELDLQKGLLELPVVFLDAASQVREICEARQTTGDSEFVVAFHEGFGPQPSGLMPAFYAAALDGNPSPQRIELGELPARGAAAISLLSIAGHCRAP
jgi:filamentous hemagglutinin family protein